MAHTGKSFAKIFTSICMKALVFVLICTLLFTGIPLHPAYASDRSPDGPPYSYSPEAEHLVVKVTSGTDPEALASWAGGKLVRTGPLNYVTLEFGSLPESISSDAGITGRTNAEGIRLKVLQYPGVLSAEWSNTYKINLESAIPNKPFETADSQNSSKSRFSASALTVGDPEYGLQWAIRKIRADEAWEEGATGQGVVVAVVDTGVDLDHPDLKDNLVQGYNAFTRSALPGAAQDDNGHGTSVAGAIAALRNNLGIVGVAFDARIMPIKVMDREGEGQDEIIADGVIWAADHGARIINMSIGSEGQAGILDDALEYAASKGCLLIAASGNKEDYVDTRSYKSQNISSSYQKRTASYSSVAYPGAHPDVIAVSAVDMNDSITGFSLTGPEVVLCAPGKRILTDYWSESEIGCAYSTGTSIAAPLVSGAAALLWSKYPGLTPAEILRALEESAYDLGERGRDNSYGYGRLDVYRALKFLEGPRAYSSPAFLGWEGGKITVSGGAGEEAGAVLTVPAGAFPLSVGSNGVEEKISVSLDAVQPPADLPEGIIPASPAYFLNWGESPVRKVLSLKLKMQEIQDLENSFRQIDSSSGSGENANSPDTGNQTGTAVEESTDGQSTEQQGTNEPNTDRDSTGGESTSGQAADRQNADGASTDDQGNGSDITPEPVNYLTYLYKWSGSRWLRVGGGIPYTAGGEMEVPLYEPGVYRAGCTPEPNIDRIAGADRIQTALEIAREAFPTGADTVIVARADDFPDALAGAPLAYKYHAPILLTFPDRIPDEVYKTIARFAPRRIFILGGTGAVSSSIENRLFNIAYVYRIAGKNRYSTAAAVAELLGTRGEAVVVNGLNFPDAIAAASHAAVTGRPILLTPADSLASETERALRKLAVTKTEIIGGEGVVSAEVARILPEARRYTGANRFATSAGVLQAYPPEGRILYVATGMNFPDALTGGVLAASNSSNILLLPSTGPTEVQTIVLETIKGRKVVALGGDGAVPEDVLKKVQQLVT